MASDLGWLEGKRFSPEEAEILRTQLAKELKKKGGKINLEEIVKKLKEDTEEKGDKQKVSMPPNVAASSESQEAKKTAMIGNKTILFRSYLDVANQIYGDRDKLWQQVEGELKTTDQKKLLVGFAKKISLEFEKAGFPLEDVANHKNAGKVIQSLFRSGRLGLAFRILAKESSQLRSVLLAYFQSVVTFVYQNRTNFAAQAAKAVGNNDQEKLKKTYATLIKNYLAQQGIFLEEVNQNPELRSIFEKSESLKSLLLDTFHEGQPNISRNQRHYLKELVAKHVLQGEGFKTKFGLQAIDEDKLRKEVRKQMAIHHPDKNEDKKKAEQNMQELSEILDLIKNGLWETYLAMFEEHRKSNK